MTEEEQKQQRLRRDREQSWHVAINRFMEGKHAEDRDLKKWEERKFMYEAKKASLEVDRVAYVFKREREGKLAKVFRKCACCSEGKHIEDNHTFCCLGTECRKCEFLLALDKAEMPIEEIDRAKAWTCVAHILSKGGDWQNEGFILTVDDRMFWDSVVQSLTTEI